MKFSLTLVIKIRLKRRQQFAQGAYRPSRVIQGILASLKFVITNENEQNPTLCEYKKGATYSLNTAPEILKILLLVLDY